MMRFSQALVLILLCYFPSAQALEVKGRLEWIHQTDMRVLVDGIVDKVNVKLGQRVKKGEILLKLDQREALANIDEAKAKLTQMQLASESAEREDQRSQELFDRGLISIEDKKTAELKLATAKAQLAKAEATLTKANITLEYTQIKAPFSGIVTQRNVWKGDVIYKTMQSKPLLSIAPGRPMLARALVTADTLQNYQQGQSASVKVRGKVYQGDIYQLGVAAARIDPQGAVYGMDIRFKPSASSNLRPTESATIILP